MKAGDGLKDRYRKEIIRILSENPRVERIVLFGSRAMGTFTPESDIDIVLYGDDLSLTDLAQLKQALEETTIPQKVDLLLAKDIEKKELLEHIKRYGVEWWRRGKYKNNCLNGKKLNNKWKEYRLSDVINIIGGGTPKRSKAEYWGGEIPWLSVKDFNNDFRHVFDAEESITEEGLKNSSTKILYPGQLIISARGTVGALAQLMKPMAFNQSCYGITAKDRKATNDFLYYLLKHTVNKLRQITHGAVFDTITRETFNHIKVSLPSLSEQRAIAHILGTLDDKIELNREMNKTLEEMAQAIFKSWFIDFDPVVWKAVKAGKTVPEKFFKRAAYYKESGKCPVPEEILTLFPDSFQDSELGPIPEGWKVSTLKNCVDIHDHKRIPLNNRERAKRKGPYPYYGASGIMDYVDDYLFEGIFVLVGEDGSVVDEQGHPITQYVWGKFWVNNHAHVLTGKSGITNEHLFLALKNTNIRPFITGAVQPKINQKNLKAVPFILSAKELRENFGRSISPLFKKIRENSEETSTLIKIRDTLLPKLISGELRVPDVEKFLKEAGL